MILFFRIVQQYKNRKRGIRYADAWYDYRQMRGSIKKDIYFEQVNLLILQ